MKADDLTTLAEQVAFMRGGMDVVEHMVAALQEMIDELHTAYEEGQAFCDAPVLLVKEV